ncbi:DNA end-binding protein Ku [Microterricola gilva]|uniref:Non-homologous end joining protein Ku n=1 Tax=Microterricola gilva TaxID=393267 RepID=A0A4Q8AP31_9MICO|nr:Ku protein [Microterricola gilva]RZU66432.1 DNA end-binding protein Ku [Microterricola gilva]
MRAIWKGSVAFGLVNVPVKLYSATEDHDITLHQVHDKDGGRIRYQRKCEVCGRIVEYEHIDKAYADDEHTVVLSDKELRGLPEERSREIEIVEFVPSAQLDPIMLDRSYYLEPDSTSPKAYVLLRRTLESTDLTAIVHFALRQKTRLGALRVRGKALMLQSLLWDDEVRAPEFPALETRVNIASKELEMSSALVSSFAADFDPSQYHDEYQAQLRKLIDEKLKTGKVVDTAVTFGKEPEAGGDVIDLMDALRRSIEKNKSATGRGKQKAAKAPARSSRTKAEKGA